MMKIKYYRHSILALHDKLFASCHALMLILQRHATPAGRAKGISDDDYTFIGRLLIFADIREPQA